jgi:hypothetical protein
MTTLVARPKKVQHYTKDEFRKHLFLYGTVSLKPIPYLNERNLKLEPVNGGSKELY